LAGQWENREAYVQAPWHEPPKIVIDEREKAISVHNSILKANTHTMVYTEGSGYQGYIGAAAVISSRNVQVTECIGTEDTSTVYAGEVCGIKFTPKSLIRLTLVSPIKEPVIFSDSQAALKTLQNPRMVSGQEYIRDCVRLLQECKDTGIDVTLRWIPGHEGVPGNEAADRAAKKAALKGVRRNIVPRDISHWTMLGAAAKRRIRQSAKDAWERSWDKQKSGKPTKKLVTHPSKRTLLYWNSLRKATSSILMQVRTERIGLAHYLWVSQAR
jgi:ribonuclease HI